jgi:NADP-dependent 3-hydroxy acid dehydrogenase YdfG
MSDLALITGASKGIGRATALKLAHEGVEILATGRNVPDLESLKDEVMGAGGKCQIHPAELNSESDLDVLFHEIKKSGKILKLLVHSAGVAKVGKVEEMKKTDWQDVIETNLSVPFYLTQRCLPLMENGSQIIFINSRAGKQTFSEWAAYCASKHGLRAMADVLRAEVSVKGIRVTTIYPASVDTPMQTALPYDWDTSKMMQPEDVARAVIDCFKQPANVIITDLELQNPAGIF